MNDTVIRAIVVEDHAMVLDAIIAGLTQRGIEIAGQAGSYAEAVDLIPLRDADIVVTDFDLGDGHGTDLVGEAARMDPSVPVLLITGIDDRKGIDAALTAGCAGFISKSQGFDQLVDAVLAVARGAAVFPNELLSRALHDGGDDVSLSSRELEVLQLLANARSVAEISDELHVSVHTTRNHIKHILAKLGARSQLEAVVIAARSGRVTID